MKGLAEERTHCPNGSPAVVRSGRGGDDGPIELCATATFVLEIVFHTIDISGDEDLEDDQETDASVDPAFGVVIRHGVLDDATMV